MKIAEQTALAVLRAGRSFADAAQASGLSVERVIELWAHESKEPQRTLNR